MEATTTTTIRCRLENGTTIDLTHDDCAEILNAMARRQMLDVIVEDIPSGEYKSIWTAEAFAMPGAAGNEDDCVTLVVNAGDFVSATPREKAKGPAKAKKAKK